MIECSSTHVTKKLGVALLDRPLVINIQDYLKKFQKENVDKCEKEVRYTQDLYYIQCVV